jgi:hypothetical protein
MPGWIEDYLLHFTFVLLSVDGFETPITDGSLSVIAVNKLNILNETYQETQVANSSIDS